MAEDKKFYWFRLKKDFFDGHKIKMIESMDNGSEYLVFYLKLLCESVSHEGKLRFSETIPYNEKMLSVITNTNIDIVKSAMDIFQTLELLTIEDDFTIYMSEVSSLMGCETASAIRQRKHRELAKNNTKCDNVTPVSQNGHIEIEYRERDKSNSIDNKESTLKSTKEKSNTPNWETSVIEDTLDVGDEDDVIEKVKEWLQYKKEKKQTYKHTGLVALIKKIRDSIDKNGKQYVIDSIDNSISQNYSGIYPPKQQTYSAKAKQETIKGVYYDEEDLSIYDR